MVPTGLPEWLSSRIQVADDGCWIWTAGRDTSGYGRVYDRRTKKPAAAHRVVYEVGGGNVCTPGLVLDHLCGVGLCVRPSHLEEITASENSRRGGTARGTRPPVIGQAAVTPQEPPSYIYQPPPRPAADEPAAKPARKQCNVRLPVDIIEALDQRRALRGLSRDEWVTRALRYALREQPAPSRPRRPTRPNP